MVVVVAGHGVNVEAAAALGQVPQRVLAEENVFAKLVVVVGRVRARAHAEADRDRGGRERDVPRLPEGRHGRPLRNARAARETRVSSAIHAAARPLLWSCRNGP